MEYVLITGASSGIGKKFAEEYAARQNNLILVSRSEKKLKAVTDSLRGTYNIKVRTIAQDLSLPDSAEKVFDFCDRENLAVGTLVNNAGFGLDGAFDSLPLEELEKMIVLHNLTLVKLTWLFLPEMKRRNQGDIINLSSVLAFQGVPYNAVYAATKTFVLTFSESIREELRHSGIRVFALCPGLTETEIFKKTGINPHRTLMPVGPPEPVVRSAIKSLNKNKSYSVPGFINKILIHGGRLLPRTAMLKLGMILGRREKSTIKRSE
ncbi:MAG: SDR family oxidoreductase [Chlorobiales bacterium]|nr:SDR family oxidoreductase [Chlorobiales bacterium]